MTHVLRETTAMEPMERVKRCLLAFVICAPIALSAALFVRFFDADEFQHLQMSWLIGQGDVPYRDFFEHHMPLYHALVAPLLRFEAIATNADAATAAVFSLRFVGLGLSILILAVVYAITRTMADRLAALFAVALLLANSMFLRKGIEIRPDQLGALLLLVSTAASLRAAAAVAPARWWFLAGVSGAAAVLTTQKVLLAVPGLGLAFLLVTLQRSKSPWDVLRDSAAIMAGSCAITLPVLAVFWANDALGVFIHSNFLLGAEWPADRIMSLYWAKRLLIDDTVFVVLALGGGALWLAGKGRWQGMGALVMLPLVALVVGMPLMPVAQQQYYFLFLPYAAVFAGLAAAGVARALVKRHGRHGMAVMALPAVIAGYGVWHILQDALAQREAKTFAKLAYVVEETRPGDTVMSAWSPGVAFRKPAFFCLSLHEEILGVIPQDRYDRLLADLRTGASRPAVIDFDARMAKLPAAIVAQLRADYVPMGVDTLWRRRPSPTDIRDGNQGLSSR